MTPMACSHCGRSECKHFGSPSCQQAREKWFEEQRKAIEYMAKRQTQPDAAGETGEKK